MKKRILSIAMFILFALPIPLSLASWIGTLMSVSAIGTVNWSNPDEWIQLFIALTAMLLAGSYLITYIFSLSKTFKNKNINITLVSFLPLLHIAVFGMFYILWVWLDTIFKT